MYTVSWPEKQQNNTTFHLQVGPVHDQTMCMEKQSIVGIGHSFVGLPPGIQFDLRRQMPTEQMMKMGDS